MEWSLHHESFGEGHLNKVQTCKNIEEVKKIAMGWLRNLFRTVLKEDKKGFIETQFDQVEFPILVEDDKGLFHLFYNRQEILGEPDLVWEFGESVCAGRLIDSKGGIFLLHYSEPLQSYYPGGNEGVMTIEAVRGMLDKYIGDIPNRPVFGGEKSLKEIFVKIDGYVE